MSLFLPVFLTPRLGAVSGQLLQALYQLLQIVWHKLLVVLIGKFQHQRDGLAAIDPQVDVRGEEEAGELVDGRVCESVGVPV